MAEHTVKKTANDLAYEVDKAKMNDPSLPMTTRAGAAMSAAGDAIASKYHESAANTNMSAPGHAVKEAEHNVQAFGNKMERKNEALPMSDRAAAATREAGHNAAASYHGAAKTADKSV